MSDQHSTEATEPKRLDGTTDEFRAKLLQFRGGSGCSAVRGDMWSAPRCGQPAQWYVGLEDAHAGMTLNGHFSPATTYIKLCDAHLAEVGTEPRLVFEIQPNDNAPRASISVIDTTAFDRLLGGES